MLRNRLADVIFSTPYCYNEILAGGCGVAIAAWHGRLGVAGASLLSLGAKGRLGRTKLLANSRPLPDDLNVSTEVESTLRDPILVTGSPRSGKTLVAWILAYVPGLTYVNEPLSAWALGAAARSDDRRTPEEATPEVIAKIRKACARELSVAGGGRYVDDLSYHSLRVEFARRVMPDAKLIHVIQDGYTTIPGMIRGWTYREPLGRSLRRRWRGLNLETFPRLAMRGIINHWESKVKGRRRAWGPQPPGLAEFARTHESPVEVAALQWKGIVETAMNDMEKLPADGALTVRFEDLLANTSAVVAQVAAFGGIDDVAAMERGAAEILDPDFAHKGTALSQEQWDRVTEIVGPLRERLGYTAAIPTRFLLQD
jgi:hypothetical protein